MMMLAGTGVAGAQTYPSRPIRIIVPLPPGANGDLMPRIREPGRSKSLHKACHSRHPDDRLRRIQPDLFCN